MSEKQPGPHKLALPLTVPDHPYIYDEDPPSLSPPTANKSSIAADRAVERRGQLMLKLWLESRVKESSSKHKSYRTYSRPYQHRPFTLKTVWLAYRLLRLHGTELVSLLTRGMRARFSIMLALEALESALPACAQYNTARFMDIIQNVGSARSGRHMAALRVLGIGILLEATSSLLDRAKQRNRDLLRVGLSLIRTQDGLTVPADGCQLQLRAPIPRHCSIPAAQSHGFEGNSQSHGRSGTPLPIRLLDAWRRI